MNTSLCFLFAFLYLMVFCTWTSFPDHHLKGETLRESQEIEHRNRNSAAVTLQWCSKVFQHLIKSPSWCIPDHLYQSCKTHLKKYLQKPANHLKIHFFFKKNSWKNRPQKKVTHPSKPLEATRTGSASKAERRSKTLARSHSSAALAWVPGGCFSTKKSP